MDKKNIGRRMVCRHGQRGLTSLAVVLFGSSTLWSASPDAPSGDEGMLVVTRMEECCPVETIVPYCPPGQNITPMAPPSSSETEPSDDAASQLYSPLIDDAPLNAATAAQDFGNQRTQSFALNTGSRGGLNAPNMIGDFFGGQGTSVTFQAPIENISIADAQAIRQTVEFPRVFGESQVDARTSTGAVEFNFDFYSGQPLSDTAARSIGINVLPSMGSPGPLGSVFSGAASFDLEMASRTEDLAASNIVRDATAALNFDAAEIAAASGTGTFNQIGNAAAAQINTARTDVLSTRPGSFVVQSQASLINDVVTTFRADNGAGNAPANADNNQFGITGTSTISFFDLLFIPDAVTIIAPTPGAGDIVGRVRMQDNNSARPQDRIFFDYNFFNNVPFAGGVDINRFTPGVEKTFGQGIGSVQVIAPMAVTISSEFEGDGPVDFSNFEFGNLVIAPKLLLFENRDFAVATGLGISLPTADDLTFGLTDGTDLLEIENDSIHLIPYIAMLYQPIDSDAFSHLFLTLDTGTNGNDVFANVTGSGLESIGSFDDQALLSLDVAYGRFVYKNARRDVRLRGLAWSSELHYTATVSDADSVTAGNFVVGDPTADLSLLNGTLGGHAFVGQTTVTSAYTAPLSDGDRVFDGEFRLFINRFF